MRRRGRFPVGLAFQRMGTQQSLRRDQTGSHHPAGVSRAAMNPLMNPVINPVMNPVINVVMNIAENTAAILPHT
jgi:hypothetical protein